MYTRTFTCTGFDGKSYEETYDFHLSRADLLKINFGDLHGLEALLKKLIDTHDGVKIMNLLDTIIMTAVGKESVDHKHFIKNEEVQNDFRSSEAYSQLFEELVLNADKSAEFLMACLPESVKQEIAKHEAEEQAKLAEGKQA